MAEISSARQKRKRDGRSEPEIGAIKRSRSDDSEAVAPRQFTHEDYTVGWICALPETELAAAAAILDEEHPVLPAADLQDTNVYVLGRIGTHNVVIACLPAETTGKVSAATVAKDMLRSFKAIRFGLMVGIGGGAPYYGVKDNDSAKDSESEDENSEDVRDIRLGDVVISLHSKDAAAVVQYDFGKSMQRKGFIRSGGTLNKPPDIVLKAISILQSQHVRKGHKIAEQLSKMISENPLMATKFQYPGSAKDQLFKSSVIHPEKKTSCKECYGPSNLVKRDNRYNDAPQLHYGTIGSADQVMKDANLRDKWAEEEKIFCFEMEAAGLMDSFPCLVIRGICDYADSHKNKIWQPYASATAAAYSKELLSVIPAAGVLGMRTIKEEMEKLSAKVAENTASSQRIERQVLTTQDEKILHWLSSSNFSEPQNTAQKLRTKGTGEWLLSREEYINWRESSGGLLWLYGAAGCGKSILCSTAIKDLQQLCQNNPRKRLAYWYFQFSDINTQSIDNMFRSLIRQLSALPLPIALRSLWDRHYNRGSNPSTHELAQTFWDLIQGWEQEIFLVFDALDEYPLSDRGGLLNCIDEFRERGNGKVHILATSRREPDIDGKLSRPPTIRVDIEQLLRDDIKLFIQAALNEEEKLKRWDKDSQTQIIKRLTAIDETRFRWADLQLKRLRQCVDKKELLDALKTIPENLEKLYEEALTKIPAKLTERVQKILMWLTSSLRPMTIEEIAAVASVNFPRDVLEICTSLLVTVIDEADKKIKLAHFTVKEYLILKKQEGNSLPWYRFESGFAEAAIAEMAITYLLDAGDSIQLRGKPIPRSLLEYSAEYWPQHAIQINNVSNMSTLQTQIDRLFSPGYSRQYINWIELYDHDDPLSYNWRSGVNYAQPLYYASLLGLEKSVKNLLETGARIVIDEGQFGNALNAAAIQGNAEIVRCLIKYHKEISSIADLYQIVNKITRNVQLTIALLLNVQDKFWVTEDAAIAAAGNYQNGKEVMTLLLKQRGADVHITEDVVKAAAKNWGSGKEVMALLLKQRGADIQITEEVVKVAAGNRKEVMTLLLEQRGADVQITEEVVKAAAGNWTEGKEVMTLLLEKRGADVQITEEVVKAAARNWKNGMEVMTLLLEKRGVDIQITEEVVKEAAGNWQNGMEVMTLLLEQRGADVQITEKVVKAAAGNWQNGMEVMILLLEKRGIDVQITEDVVKAAAGNPKKEVMTLLLEQRADIQITEEAVKAAAGNPKKEVMTLLLEQRADIQITEEVVKAAAGNWGSGKEVMALLLKQRGADIQITEEVLNAAATSGVKATLHLIEEKCDVNIHTSNLLPICQLFHSARTGNAKGVSLSLELGVSSNLKDIFNRSPLWHSALNGHLNIVRLFLGRPGVDLNSQDNISGFTALFIAAVRGCQDITELLLEAGADPNILGNDGRTLLEMAQSRGLSRIVKRLTSL